MTHSNSRSGHSVIDVQAAPSRAKGFSIMAGLFAIGLGLCGCPVQFQRVTMNETIKPEEVSFIIPGQTTFWDVIQKLGPPDQITVSSEPSVSCRGKACGGRLGVRPAGQPESTDEPPANSKIGAVARYRFLDLKRIQANFTSWVPYVFPPSAAVPNGSTLGNAGFGTDEFQVVLDRNWVVRYYAFSKDAQHSFFGIWPFDIEGPHPYQLHQIAF